MQDSIERLADRRQPFFLFDDDYYSRSLGLKVWGF